MSNKKFINLSRKITLSTALMMGALPIANVSASSNYNVEASNELQTLENSDEKIEKSKRDSNVSEVLMEKNLAEKNIQLTESIFKKPSMKNNSDIQNLDKKEKSIDLNHETNNANKIVRHNEIKENINKLNDIEHNKDKSEVKLKELEDTEEIYEIEFFHFANDDSDIILNQENRKIVLPESILITVFGEKKLNEKDMFKIKVDKNRYVETLLSNKDKNLDTILSILTKEDTDAIEIMKDIKKNNLIEDMSIEKLIDLKEEKIDILDLSMDRNFEEIKIEDDLEDEEEVEITEDEIEILEKSLDKSINELTKDILYKELNEYLDLMGYEETEENKGFIEGFVSKENVNKEGKFEESHKKLYAHTDSPVYLQNGNFEEIDVILSEESIEIIGENDQWYKVSLRDLYENYDELEVEDEFAIVEKKNFQDKPIFHEEEGVLFAKHKVKLYSSPDETDESKYHVNKDGSIIQVERALEWIKIKLDDGTELYAKTQDFDDVDSSGVNRYQRTYTVAKKVTKDKSSNSQGTVIKAPRNTDNPVGEDIVEFATQFVGNKYVWGGNSLTNGVDCSGFTKEIYKKYGVNLPRWSGHQANVGKEVSLSEAKPGDIVTYDGHVAIYMGNGKIVHAANKRKGIITSNVNYGKPIKSIRRVIE